VLCVPARSASAIALGDLRSLYAEKFPDDSPRALSVFLDLFPFFSFYNKTCILPLPLLSTESI
jgi:hypothetical protein